MIMSFSRVLFTTVAACLLAFSFTQRAEAIVISPSQDGLFVFNFGSVAVGDLATSTFTVSWINEGSENYVVGAQLSDSGTGLDPFHVSVISCAVAGPCTFSLSFSPTSVAAFSASTLSDPGSFPSGLMQLVQEFDNEFVFRDPFHLTLNGNGIDGVSETPVPGALPLFATGLGMLGFVVHRRKRKASAA